jgi:hypothetical protein
VFADDRKFFSITNAGREALGADAPPREPWVKVEAVAASLARDVVARNGQEPDDRTRVFRSMVGSMGAQGSMATARLRKVGSDSSCPPRSIAWRASG